MISQIGSPQGFTPSTTPQKRMNEESPELLRVTSSRGGGVLKRGRGRPRKNIPP